MNRQYPKLTLDDSLSLSEHHSCSITMQNGSSVITAHIWKPQDTLNKEENRRVHSDLIILKTTLCTKPKTTVHNSQDIRAIIVKSVWVIMNKLYLIAEPRLWFLNVQLSLSIAANQTLFLHNLPKSKLMLTSLTPRDCVAYYRAKSLCAS